MVNGISAINCEKFSETMNIYGQDRCTKKLAPKDYILLMLYAHLIQKNRFHALKATLASNDLAQAAGIVSISVVLTKLYKFPELVAQPLFGCFPSKQK